MECVNCGKETVNPKFCSRSCSVSYTNCGVRRNGQEPGNCLHCGTKLKSSSAKYCNATCQCEHRYIERIRQWQNGELDSPGKSSVRRYLSEKAKGCWSCGITEWNGKDIVLELEHIDGNSQNNTEENLALICPNCHSQTDTYKGKNRGNGRHYRRVRYAEGKSF